MLAAASERSEVLEMVRLTLSLIESGETNIPESLKDHLVKVFNEAKILAENPKSLSEQALSDSIQLAVEIKRFKGLSKELNKVSGFDAISPALAQRLRTTMEHHPVCQN